MSLFLLSRQLLSSQQHYDWGLRALKPILTLAGRLLQEIKASQSEPLREDEEAVLLLKAGEKFLSSLEILGIGRDQWLAWNDMFVFGKTDTERITWVDLGCFEGLAPNLFANRRCG